MMTYDEDLVGVRVDSLGLDLPLDELVRVVGNKVVGSGSEDLESVAVSDDLGPISLNVLQVLGHVHERSLENLVLKRSVHRLVGSSKLLPSSSRLSVHVVGSLLDSSHESGALFGVLGDKVFVGDEH